MSELGSLLKKTREKQGKTLRSVKDDTRIQESFLTAIEDGNFYALPSYLHVYGFVKKYAEYLGFDYEEIKPLFDKECPKSDGLTHEEPHKNEELYKNEEPHKNDELRQLIVTPSKAKTVVKKKTADEKKEEKLNNEVLPEINEEKLINKILPEIKEEKLINKTASEKKVLNNSDYNNRKKISKIDAETPSNIGKKKNISVTGIIVAGIVILAVALIISSVSKDKPTEPVAEIDVTYDNFTQDTTANNMTTPTATPPEESLGAMLAADNKTLDATTADNMTDNMTDNATLIDNMTGTPVLINKPIEPLPIVPSSIVLTFTEECWIKFTPDNKTSVEFIAQAGNKTPLKFEKTFILDIGNAAAVIMAHDNRTYSGFGRPGTVRKLIYTMDNGSLVRVTN